MIDFKGIIRYFKGKRQGEKVYDTYAWWRIIVISFFVLLFAAIVADAFLYWTINNKMKDKDGIFRKKLSGVEKPAMENVLKDMESRQKVFDQYLKTPPAVKDPSM